MSLLNRWLSLSTRLEIVSLNIRVCTIRNPNKQGNYSYLSLDKGYISYSALWILLNPADLTLHTWTIQNQHKTKQNHKNEVVFGCIFHFALKSCKITVLISSINMSYFRWIDIKNNSFAYLLLVWYIISGQQVVVLS